MTSKNTRSRTGCLSCRQRRVKCDERKPSCERCEAANVFCAGYQHKRHVEPRQLRQDISSPYTEQSASGNARSTNDSDSHHQSSSPRRPYESSYSLAPLPNSPRPDQSPGSGARQVLGYYHFLSKTLPLLFPFEDLYFWRDVLCQEAWGSEYIHLTLVALGNLHRGVIMMAAPEETAQQSGLQEKLNAVQQYTQALQELASHLDEATDVPEVLIGVLCLMAYFEVRFQFVVSRIMRYDCPDSIPVIQRQSARLHWACEGCRPLFADPRSIARWSRCRVGGPQVRTSGGLFAFTQSDMSHGCAVSSPLVTTNSDLFLLSSYATCG
jgi:hypothetical protein